MNVQKWLSPRWLALTATIAVVVAKQPQAAGQMCLDPPLPRPHYARHLGRGSSSSPTPRFRIVRTRCTIQVDGHSATVEWDPAAAIGPSRSVMLPGRAAAKNIKLFCSSEARRFETTSDGRVSATSLATFRFWNCASRIVPTCQGHSWTKTSCGELGAIGPHTEKIDGPTTVGICLREEPPSPSTESAQSNLLDSWADESSVAQTRSLDPLTPIAEDLVKTIADVAVDRAEAAGAALIRDKLSDALCNWLTEEALWENFAGNKGMAALFVGFDAPDPDKAFYTPLLPRTCNVVNGLRVQELGASSKLVERALGIDLTNIGFRMIRGTLSSANDRELVPLVEGVRQMILSLLEGRSVSSERDVQLLLLRLGEIGLPTELDDGKAEWRRALEMGMSVLVECVRQGTCNADRLSRMLDGEVQSLARESDARYAAALDEWPELRSMLGRAVDVLRPPPGVSPRATAKAMFNMFFDVLDHQAALALEATKQQIAGPMNYLADWKVFAKRGDPAEAHHAQEGVKQWLKYAGARPEGRPGKRDAPWRYSGSPAPWRNAILDENLSEAVIESSSFLTGSPR